MDQAKKKKIKKFLILEFSILIIAAIVFVALYFFTKNKRDSSGSTEVTTQEQIDAQELNDELVKLVNDSLASKLDKHDSKYQVDRLISINIDTNELYYCANNNSYLYSISLQFSSDLLKTIKEDTYTHLEIKMKDVVTTESDPLLQDNAFVETVKGNYTSTISKTNDLYRYIDATYVGKDDKYYSICSFEYENGNFSIEGMEENNTYSVSLEENAMMYYLLDIIATK